MNVLLVRHTSVAVPAGYAYGQTDVPLGPSFEEEAREVKRLLRGETFDKVWSSPLTRCLRLAAYCGYPFATHDDRLKELDFGEWEMMPWDEISADPRSDAWFTDWIGTQAPCGESLSDQYARVRSFLDELQGCAFQNVCIFTHGGVIACAHVYAGECALRDAFKSVPPYGSVIRLKL